MDNFLINSCLNFCQNFKNIDISSITDYVPNEFQEKIFADIKEKGLNNSFILEYDLDTFKHYVNKENFKYYDKFMSKFKGTNDLNFTILILNWDVLNDNKIKEELNECDKQVKNLIDNLFKDKNTLNRNENLQALQNLKIQANNIYENAFKKNINEDEAKKLFYSLKNPLSKQIYNQIMGMLYRNDCKMVFESMDKNHDQMITKDEAYNYMKLLRICEFQGSKQFDETTCGFCLNLKQNFKVIDGFTYFINKEIILQSQQPLHEVYDLINHEIDHYFETSINTPDNAELKAQADLIDPADKQIIDSINTQIFTDKQFLYYLFERSQFNSRCTDVCNFLLTSICPLEKDNSLNNFLDAINNIIKYDNLAIMQIKNYSWFKQTQKIMAIVAFSAVTLKLFPNSKWLVLKDRLEKDFNQFEQLSQQQKNLYTEEIKKKFSN